MDQYWFLHSDHFLRHRFLDLKNTLNSVSISDEQTKETIKEVYQKEDYLLDPHGAVAYFALDNYLKEHPQQKGYLLETAHPVKFYDIVEPVIQRQVPIPENISLILKKEKNSLCMNPDFEDLKEYLLK